MKLIEKVTNHLENLVKIKFFSNDENYIIQNILKNPSNDLDVEVKIKILEALKYMVKRSKINFGMLIVYGWKREWNKEYAYILDENQNLFEEKNYNIKNLSVKKIVNIFNQLRTFDGAILINKEGKILASGVFLINLNPLKVMERMNLKGEDLSDVFGFKSKVHTRHITAITASYILPNTTVYTVSEEEKIIRIYEKGKIIYSTLSKEQKEILKEIGNNEIK